MLTTIISMAQQIVTSLISYFVNQTIEKMNRVQKESGITNQKYLDHYNALLELRTSIIDYDSTILDRIAYGMEDAESRWEEMKADKSIINDKVKKDASGDNSLGI